MRVHVYFPTILPPESILKWFRERHRKDASIFFSLKPVFDAGDEHRHIANELCYLFIPMEGAK